VLQLSIYLTQSLETKLSAPKLETTLQFSQIMAPNTSSKHATIKVCEADSDLQGLVEKMIAAVSKSSIYLLPLSLTDV
jgi:hypothetical protein